MRFYPNQIVKTAKGEVVVKYTGISYGRVYIYGRYSNGTFVSLKFEDIISICASQGELFT